MLGPDAPRTEKIDDLLRLLVTVRERMGNTCVAYRIRFGASGLWAFSEQGEQISQLREKLASIRTQIEDIVCTEGEDKGLILLSHDGPTHFDPERKIQVYDHEFFSPLGDAMIALHNLTVPDEEKGKGTD